ncbi:MAG TPA: hypothetical protein ENF43_03850 [Thermoplasmatales archaeon]|nr:hypothetical protein [Thermoplasmatales archaeon]
MQSVEPKRFDNKVKILAIWVVGIILGFAIVINIETILIFISNHLPTILIASIVILYIITMIGMIFTEGEETKEKGNETEEDEGDILIPYVPF